MWKTLGYATSYDEVKTWNWFIAGGPAFGELFADKASARSTVDAWLASRGNGSEYVVVYVR